MVCCALLSILIAAVLWLAAPGRLRGAGRNPLTWRPYGSGSGKQPARPDRAGFTLSARLGSIACAIAGLRFMLRREHNAWIHAAATVLVIAAGLALGIAAADWRWIALAILWVWFAEAVNTALERLCDVVSPGPNQAVRIAKDVAAGAVLLSAVGAAILGALTLMPYLLSAVIEPGVDLAFCRAVR